MKRIIGLLALIVGIILAGPVMADAVQAPLPDKGDTTWLIVATLLVVMMAVPGLPLFYGGMVRTKNMLSIAMRFL